MEWASLFRLVFMKNRDNIKNIAVLGSTGSIGLQTLDVCEEYPDRLRPTVLVAGHKVDELAEQALRWNPKMAVIADSALESRLREKLADTKIQVASGEQAVKEAMTIDEVDTVVTATVGYSGLAPTLAAIEAGKDIALANKETLVVAGELVTKKLAESSSRVIPVDSEHSAIYQCLVGESKESVKKLIITASGGPFRTWSVEQIAKATRQDALHHPNWSMGAKITIDSATMVNKAFEIIEARWLFGVKPEQIEAIVHPQSIIHSMVEF
jgi:1-deoxy-D-xylulose-5-phosphate reductoisomerase